MKYIIIASALVVALSNAACANEGGTGRKRPMDNGRPDKTDHVRPTPLDLGRPTFTVDGYETHRGDCRVPGDRCGRK